MAVVESFFKVWVGNDAEIGNEYADFEGNVNYLTFWKEKEHLVNFPEESRSQIEMVTKILNNDIDTAKKAMHHYMQFFSEIRPVLPSQYNIMLSGSMMLDIYTKPMGWLNAEIYNSIKYRDAFRTTTFHTVKESLVPAISLKEFGISYIGRRNAFGSKYTVEFNEYYSGKLTRSSKNLDSINEIDTFLAMSCLAILSTIPDISKDLMPIPIGIYSNEFLADFPNKIMNKRERQIFDTFRIMKRTDIFYDAQSLIFNQGSMTLKEYQKAVESKTSVLMYINREGDQVSFADYHNDIMNEDSRNYYHDFIAEFIDGHVLQIEFAGYRPDDQFLPTYSLKRDADARNNQEKGSPTIFIVDSPETKALYLNQLNARQNRHTTIGKNVPILTSTEFGHLMKAWILANTAHYRANALRTDHLDFMEFVRLAAKDCLSTGIPADIAVSISNAFGYDINGLPKTSYRYVTKNHDVTVSCNFDRFREIWKTTEQGSGLLAEQLDWIYSQINP
ncbi:MAG: hypothetical protein ACTSRK_20700 [Promethearchaeota archaeon]